MTTVRLLKNGAEAFPAMFTAIQQARYSIALEMYIIADDDAGRELRDHLTAAAGRGLLVEVLVDSWGSWNLPDAFWDGFLAADGKVKWFHPIAKGVFFFRNHRKLLLVDDSIAYIGGMNVSEEYYRGAHGEPPWRDNMVEITGPETAWLRHSFGRMWARAGSSLRRLLLQIRREVRVIPGGGVRFLESGPENPVWPVRRVYRQVVQKAEQDINLAMGYFYPHGKMLRALKRAVNRGVRVRLLFSQKTDVPVSRWAARGLYGRLLRAGIEVWEYLPSMMHAKLAIADDTVVAGSANLDVRSGRINYELVVVVTDAELASQARADFEDDLKQSVRILLEEWKSRPLIQKLKERFSYWLLARADIFFARREIARKMK
ncbi:MAG: phospholipase D-like domain-containing protein [Nitrospirae bacterium]|nr:phospholipase D-like domain-containing protein [Nitrospirota bacterium]